MCNIIKNHSTFNDLKTLYFTAGTINASADNCFDATVVSKSLMPNTEESIKSIKDSRASGASKRHWIPFVRMLSNNAFTTSQYCGKIVSWCHLSLLSNTSPEPLSWFLLRTLLPLSSFRRGSQIEEVKVWEHGYECGAVRCRTRSSAGGHRDNEGSYLQQRAFDQWSRWTPSHTQLGTTSGGKCLSVSTSHYN